eukprot:COSAG06_NODE_7616_length_2438_cov_1.542540_2_plen_367_part_00
MVPRAHGGRAVDLCWPTTTMVYVVDYGIDVGTMAAGPQGNYLILLSVKVYAGGGGDPHGNAVRAFERDKSGGKGLQTVLAALGLAKQRRWKRAFCLSGMNMSHPGPAGHFEDEDEDEDGGVQHGYAIPGSVLELVQQKLGGASSSPEKLALQTVRKRLLLARLWAASTAVEAARTTPDSPDPTPQPEPESEPELEPEQQEPEPEPEPAVPAPRGLVRTSSGDAGTAAARQVMQQKAAAKKPAARGTRKATAAGDKPKAKAKPKKGKGKTKKAKKPLPSSWAADVTAAASRLPGEVYERIGSSVAAAEQAAAAAAAASPQAAASSRDGLSVHGSAAFGFGRDAFGKNNMLLPKFLKELEAACRASGR